MEKALSLASYLALVILLSYGALAMLKKFFDNNKGR